MLYSFLLEPGLFYRSRDGHIWCCFRLNHGRVLGEPGESAEAECVRVADNRIESFYRDGRYDSNGKREHTLISRATP